MGKSTKRHKKFAPKVAGVIAKRRFEKKDKLKKTAKAAIADHNSDEDDEKVHDEVASHLASLEKLKETQKEFMDFLEAEDAAELKFGQDREDEPEDDSEIEEEGEETAQPGKNTITQQHLDSWKKRALGGEALAIRRLISSYRVACHLNDPEDKEGGSEKKMTILNSEVFNDIMLFCLDEMTGIFDKLLKRQAEDDIKIEDEEPKPKKSTQVEQKLPDLPNKFPGRWKKVSASVKSFLSSTIHFLGSITEEKMICYVLRQTEKWPQYFGPFEKLANAFVKKLFGLWGSSTEAVRILSFLNIRKLAIQVPYPFLDRILKGIYLNYVRNAKFVNPKTIPLIHFMSNCVVELYSLDSSAAYQHAFVYIREISIHLRNACLNKSKEKHLSVYNWQTLYSIRVWVKLLCACPKDTQLWLLAYPLIQLINGVVGLVATPKHYPLRCHYVQLLNELAAAKSPVKGMDQPVFINSASFLLEMLQYPVFFKKPTPYSGKPLDFQFLLAIPPKMVASKAFTDAILREFKKLALEYFSVYATSIAFPELVVPVLVACKKFIKQIKIPQYAQSLRGLVDALQTNSTFMIAKRNLVNFAPTDKQKTVTFSIGLKKVPLLTYKATQDKYELQQQQQEATKVYPANLKKEKIKQEPQDEEELEDDSYGSGDEDLGSEEEDILQDEYEGDDVVEDFEFSSDEVESD